MKSIDSKVKCKSWIQGNRLLTSITHMSTIDKFTRHVYVYVKRGCSHFK